MSLLALVSLSACENEDSNDVNEDPNANGGSSSNLTNNTLVVGAQSSALNLYTVHQATDVNTNKEYIEIYIFKDDLANRDNYLLMTLKEIPTSSKTLSWQSGSSAPGDLTADQFTLFPKLADQRWYGVYSSTGFETTGDMQATVNGSKLTLSFEDIELADNFISTNVNARENVSGKFTFNTSDLQNLPTRPSAPKSLIDE